MVLSAGSVEGHLIIVRSKLQIEAVFIFCLGLPESPTPDRVTVSWSCPREALSNTRRRRPNISDWGIRVRLSSLGLCGRCG